MRLIVAVFMLFPFLSNCSRSQGYRQDSSDPDSAPKSYYSGKNDSAASVSERIETMGQPRKRIAVLSFWNDTPVRAPEIGGFGADELRRALAASRRVIIPMESQSTLETKDFVQGTNIKVAQLIREGRRLGVAVIVVGRIPKLVFRQRGDDVGILRQTQTLAAADVELKLFDVQAGREIAALGRSGEASTTSMVSVDPNSVQSQEYRKEMSQLAIREAVNQLVPDVVKSIEKMTWEGKIAKIAGNKIYLNSGRASGLVPGDILRVITQGEELYDPSTGAYLGRTEGQLKGTLEVIDYVGEDSATATIHTGGNFRDGDLVRLY